MFKFDDMNNWDFLFVKLATASLVLILLKVWPTAMNWVHNTNVWWFILAFVVFAVRAGAKGRCCVRKPVKKKVVRRRRKKKK
ncbi:hypothetical protein HNV12_04205 [Methanococcoides sp. SA1]|nr:hypothetical protein [Methanococcoides sp. SA1]